MSDWRSDDPDDILEPGDEESEESDLGPSSPEVTIPNVSSPDPAENYDNADPEFKTQFWKLVFTYKVGILATTLGAVVVFFRGSTVAVQAVALGTVVLAYALYETYTLKNRVESGEFDHDIEDEAEDET